MNADCLKLTTYAGERTLAGRRFVSDALMDVYARHELRTSLVMRGAQGFGPRHSLRTDRLLTLSEDLPLVAVAVDDRRRIERVLTDVEALRFDGLVTLERARMLTGRIGRADIPETLHGATKLTVYVGRHERIEGRPAARAVVELLHRSGVAGATVLLGVDGTAHGVRERARFVARNARVPLMIVSVGDGERIAAALPALARTLRRPLMTLERVAIHKRDGVALAPPGEVPASDPSGLGVWRKLMVYVGEDDLRDGRPVYRALVEALREAGAAGATTLRGIWGYHGGHGPHGDVLWQLRRRAPMVTVIVDRPERARTWLRIADEVTGEKGLVTSEIVPAYRATGPAHAHGGLRLARRIG